MLIVELDRPCVTQIDTINTPLTTSFPKRGFSSQIRLAIGTPKIAKVNQSYNVLATVLPLLTGVFIKSWLYDGNISVPYALIEGTGEFDPCHQNNTIILATSLDAYGGFKKENFLALKKSNSKVWASGGYQTLQECRAEGLIPKDYEVSQTVMRKLWKEFIALHLENQKPHNTATIGLHFKPSSHPAENAPELISIDSMVQCLRYQNNPDKINLLKSAFSELKEPLSSPKYSASNNDEGHNS